MRAVRAVVVGAGIAGVACAVTLAAGGVDVRVVERARTVGGRMASRRLDGRPVDLGAAYFTVRDDGFAQVVARWRAAGLARPWTSELAVLGGDGPDRAPGPLRWAAPGGLRSLVAALTEGLPVALEQEVARIGPGPTVDGEPADAVVLAMPDPQAERLLDGATSAAALVAGRAWRSVISVAAGWERREWAPLPAAFVNDHPLLSIVADDGARRGVGAPVLVAHTTDEPARRYDARPDDAVAPVLDALRDLLGITATPAWTYAHRWRYAQPAEPREAPFHLGDDGVCLAGDGWGSPRVETAWRSGTDLARALVARGRSGG